MKQIGTGRINGPVEDYTIFQGRAHLSDDGISSPMDIQAII